MSLPELTTVAQGDLPGGQHWILQAGGTGEDFYTFLETVHPDGHRDQGGMGGPLLYPGRLVNAYSGGDDRGLLRLIVRADSRVARLRLTLTTGERLELAAVATDADLGVSYFAALLPRTTGLAGLTPSTPRATPSPLALKRARAPLAPASSPPARQPPPATPATPQQASHPPAGHAPPQLASHPPHASHPRGRPASLIVSTLLPWVRTSLAYRA